MAFKWVRLQSWLYEGMTVEGPEGWAKQGMILLAFALKLPFAIDERTFDAFKRVVENQFWI